MLVALNHMQVSVCYLQNMRLGRGVIPGFRKNIISFPQDINDLKNVSHFFTNLAANDVVNVLDSTACDATRTLRRARVVQLEGTGVRIRLS